MKRLLNSQLIVSHPSCRQFLCSSLQKTSQRSFASRRKTRATKRPNKKQPPSPRSKQLPPGVFLPEPSDSIPPLYLSTTGSPWAYVATCAVEEANMDASSLFSDEQQPPFVHAAYISPKELKHELPKWNIPEVAVLGRSNVGKSTLVNALLHQNLAYCSKQPGRTQQVNYYGMYSSPTMKKSPSEAIGFLVDLPGYGYAAAPPNQVQAWQERTQTFLQHRRDQNVLKRLFLLIDARRGSSQIDRDIMGWMDDAMIAYSVVLTKADRVGRPQLVKHCNDVCARHHSQVYGDHGGMQGPIVHITSSRDGHGITELLTLIHAEFAGHEEEATMLRQASASWTDDRESYDDEDKEEEDSSDSDDSQR